MLDRSHRLVHQRDYRRVYRHGRRVRVGTLQAVVLTQRDERIRLGIVVSNKVDKRATVRNRLKRQLRAFLRELLGNLKLGYDCVVIASPSTTKLPTADLRGELTTLLRRAKLLTTKS